VVEVCYEGVMIEIFAGRCNIGLVIEGCGGLDGSERTPLLFWLDMV